MKAGGIPRRWPAGPVGPVDRSGAKEKDRREQEGQSAPGKRAKAEGKEGRPAGGGKGQGSSGAPDGKGHNLDILI
ncbi:MAG TPA: hypothetical protein VK008_04900 [Sphingobacteriaceae bacterium]|nr:hypothetical protein [Sphingobacteriaceae bacterium]